MNHVNEKGQLLLPMLALLFLSGMFVLTLILWCRQTYWEMRLSAAADMTALSAARLEAEHLNIIATYQSLENPFLPKAKVGEYNVSVLTPAQEQSFQRLNTVLRITEGSYSKAIPVLANLIARENGAQAAVPTPRTPTSHLVPQGVHTLVFYGWIPKHKFFPKAYFARDWFPRFVNPQPIHRTTWTVVRGRLRSSSAVRLWLDVRDGSKVANGGFPSKDPSFLRGLGIQCFYPQFNARLVPKQGNRR